MLTECPTPVWRKCHLVGD